MIALPVIPTFRLCEDGVHCGADGLHVGAIPLLRRDARGSWAPRPPAEVEPQLADLYGAPIDISRKIDRLTTVGRALDRGDAALASIAAVLLGFPDPPGLSKDAPARGALELMVRLAASGLLKDWDSDQHPRAGCPPNAGWFAQKPKEAGEAGLFSEESFSRTPHELFRLGARLARAALGVRITVRASGVLEASIDLLDSGELNHGDQQVVEQLRTSMDPPRPLEELQRPQAGNALGYQLHRIVEENPANIAKAPVARQLQKFSREALDDPCNLAWVPTYKHELISDYYNSKDAEVTGRTHRQVVDDWDFPGQFAAGLSAMRRYGVLQ